MSKKTEEAEKPSKEDLEQQAKDQDDTDRLLGNGKYARDPQTGKSK